MKKYSVKLANLALFFATGAAIGMESPQKLIIQNEAWGYGTGNYDIKISVNDSKEEIQIPGGERKDIGNLNGINQISIRRSGAFSSYIPSFVGVSAITSAQLNEIKQEADENIGKDLTLVIGATSTRYGLYTYYWGNPMQQKGEKPTATERDPWSIFPQAKAAKEKLDVNFFNEREQLSKLIAVAKLVFGFKIQDNPDKETIKKRYRELSLRFHPDKAKDLSASMIHDKFADEIYKIVVQANKILEKQ